MEEWLKIHFQDQLRLVIHDQIKELIALGGEAPISIDIEMIDVTTMGSNKKRCVIGYVTATWDGDKDGDN